MDEANVNPEKPFRLLVVEDDPGHRATLKTIIRSWGYEVETAPDGADAVARVRETPFDLVLMDIRMANMSGIEALKAIQAYNPAVPVLIMTAYSSVESAVAALKAGAYDYLTKPLDFEALRHAILRVQDHVGTKAENRELKARLARDFDLANLVGKSRPMKELIEMVSMVAPAEATVLITGASGTGKELIARCLHHNSRRRDRPLVTVNCAALAETLLESELFGHEKGAFTGADKRRDGRFAQADQGTLFLDEVGEMPPAMQAKLLRALQEGEVERVGSDRPVQVDVRVIAATNRDLAVEVAAGRFREDLFYRLNVVAINVPPLSERQEDIPLLAQFFLEKYAARNRKQIKGFSPLAMDMLLKYPWPGNVRELENVVERGVILLTGEWITEREFPMSVTGSYDSQEAWIPSQAPAAAGRTLEAVEKEAVIAALAAADGNKSEAARHLGINRKTLHQKLKKYGLA